MVGVMEFSICIAFFSFMILCPVYYKISAHVINYKDEMYIAYYYNVTIFSVHKGSHLNASVKKNGHKIYLSKTSIQDIVSKVNTYINSSSDEKAVRGY